MAATSRPASRRDRAAGADRRAAHSRRGVRSCSSRASALCHAHEQRAPARVPAERRLRAVEEHDEIDVARIVELARAVLAEREHDDAAAALRIGRLDRARAARRARAGAEGSERRADGGVGEAGQRLGRRTTSQTPPRSASAISSADFAAWRGAAPASARPRSSSRRAGDERPRRWRRAIRRAPRQETGEPRRVLATSAQR